MLIRLFIGILNRKILYLMKKDMLELLI